MDDRIRLSSGKEIPYEQIDDVKLSRDYEPMVLLTFGNAWQLTLKAGARSCTRKSCSVCIRTR